MNGKQTIIRDYYALPAMIERKIVIDFLIWADARVGPNEQSAKLQSRRFESGSALEVVSTRIFLQEYSL